MVKKLPANAGATRSIPGLGRFHMPQSNPAPWPQLLSPCTRAWELQLLKAMALELILATGEVTAMRSLVTPMKSSPHSLQLEKSLHSNEDSSQPKINK